MIHYENVGVKSGSCGHKHKTIQDCAKCQAGYDAPEYEGEGFPILENDRKLLKFRDGKKIEPNKMEAEIYREMRYQR